MHLSDYFKGLRKGQQIDEMILDTIRNRMNPAPDFLGRTKWKYSAVINWNYEFVYVPWEERGICYGSVDVPTHDVLSNQFRGCYMASYTDNTGARNGCHIQLVARGHPDDCRVIWNEYVRTLANPNCIVFQPNADLLMQLERKYRKDSFDLWGLISNLTGECFSIVVKTSANYIMSNYNPRFRSEVYLMCLIKEPNMPTHIIQ